MPGRRKLFCSVAPKNTTHDSKRLCTLQTMWQKKSVPKREDSRSAEANCEDNNCEDNGNTNEKKIKPRCNEVKQRAMTGKITHVDEEVESVNTEHATPSEVDISPTIPICQSTGLACTSDLIEKSLEEEAMLPDNVTADDVRLLNEIFICHHDLDDEIAHELRTTTETIISGDARTNLE